eukprot:CAMPEP_0170452650 /NCGR_PEP_ID=MMETSP0123-20130129/1478_1 /TAXON_ID=182087 /ORGANISM="Favella ehrenbergii, Strain Fehren 1" /LENGTH=52 /DNA_ID=CAMNT_0010714727 /DNA_START=2656 /DNA_END=2811 /DNA_ORIENTATION=-
MILGAHVFLIRVEAPCFSEVGPVEAEGHAAASISKHDLSLVQVFNLLESVRE